MPQLIPISAVEVTNYNGALPQLVESMKSAALIALDSNEVLGESDVPIASSQIVLVNEGNGYKRWLIVWAGPVSEDVADAEFGLIVGDEITTVLEMYKASSFTQLVSYLNSGAGQVDGDYSTFFRGVNSISMSYDDQDPPQLEYVVLSYSRGYVEPEYVPVIYGTENFESTWGNNPVYGGESFESPWIVPVVPVVHGTEDFELPWRVLTPYGNEDFELPWVVDAIYGTEDFELPWVVAAIYGTEDFELPWVVVAIYGTEDFELPWI